MAGNNKKYVVFENYLNSINSEVISLKDKEIARNNIILRVVTDKIIVQMKQKDPLFGALYKDKFYGGSFYDGLKVGRPDEFDLDMILLLPAVIEPAVKCSQKPGFVQVEIKQYQKMLLRPEAEKTKFSKMTSLLDGNFLSTSKIQQWMEGVMQKALTDLPDDNDGNGKYVLSVLDNNETKSLTKIYAKMRKGGPAFTLKLSGTDVNGSKIELSIDLVPCFQFDASNWPCRSKGYRPNPSKNKNTFLVVPKKPKGDNAATLPDIEKYWRLSFQEQERELISDDKKVLKPSLRLLKKLRDKLNHNIASYFIKTIFLWTVDVEDASFWSQSLSVVLISMLKKYEQYMRSGLLPYYWHSEYNLIGDLNDITKTNIANTLKNIAGKIDQSVEGPFEDPSIIGNYFLSKDELDTFKPDNKPTKKQIKKIQFAATSIALNSRTVDSTDSLTPGAPPLQLLGFDAQVTQLLRQYSDTQEANQKKAAQEVMAQINGTSNAVTSFMAKLDEKMDKILEKLDQSLEETRKTVTTVEILEEKVRRLESENRSLRSRLGRPERSTRNWEEDEEVNNIDALLNSRQVENIGNSTSSYFNKGI